MTIDDDTLLLLNAYGDGELSPGEALAMERRLAADPELRAQAERLARLSGALRPVLAAGPTPERLRPKIVQEVGFGPAPHRRLSAWPIAASLALGLLIGGGATHLAIGPAGRGVETAVLSAHLRGLAAPQPFDVASSNRHVVKPWFNGRTTLAPEVVDLADRGFPLMGGRIDVIDGRTVPTLVYRRDQHVISVTVLPRGASVGEALPAEDERDGYTIERWRAGDLAYVAVSDVAAADLRSFVALFRAETPGTR